MRAHSIAGVLEFVALQAVLVVSTVSAGWVPNGNRLSPDLFTSDGQEIPLAITSDGAGGAYLARGTQGPFGARLDRLHPDGTIATGFEDGLYYSGGIWWPGHGSVVPDGRGGAFVVSNDVGCLGAHCAGNFSWARVHHVHSSGVTAPGWSEEGVDFGSQGEAGYGHRQVAAINNEQGGVLITWARRAVEDRSSQPRDLRLQRVVSLGRPRGDSEGSDCASSHGSRTSRRWRPMASEGRTSSGSMSARQDSTGNT